MSNAPTAIAISAKTPIFLVFPKMIITTAIIAKISPILPLKVIIFRIGDKTIPQADLSPSVICAIVKSADNIKSDIEPSVIRGKIRAG